MDTIRGATSALLAPCPQGDTAGDTGDTAGSSSQASLSTRLALLRCWDNFFSPGSADLKLHCATRVKIKLGADVKSAAAQSCILPDFPFCLPSKSIPKAMRALGSESSFGNQSSLPIYQILSTLLKYFRVWKGPVWPVEWTVGTETLGTHKASAPIRQPTQDHSHSRGTADGADGEKPPAQTWLTGIHQPEMGNDSQEQNRSTLRGLTFLVLSR